MDITSLYTSINHIDGLRACEPFLVGRPIQCYKHELILFLIKWYLNNNFFAFDNDVYQQLRGVAMGACFSPSYACLPVGWWGERVLKTTYQVAFNNNVIAWLCYIDDVFVSWKGTAESGLKFVSDISQNDLNLEINATISATTIEFLDVTFHRE